MTADQAEKVLETEAAILEMAHQECQAMRVVAIQEECLTDAVMPEAVRLVVVVETAEECPTVVATAEADHLTVVEIAEGILMVAVTEAVVAAADREVAAGNFVFS